MDDEIERLVSLIEHMPGEGWTPEQFAEALTASGWRKVGEDEVVVPREPTPEMVERALDRWYEGEDWKVILGPAVERCRREMREALKDAALAKLRGGNNG